MPSIVTITFNPAIDKSTTVASLVPDRKLSCTAPVYEPGGGGINVARAIRKLGGTALAVYLAGGPEGEKLTRLLEKEQVPTLPVKTKDSTRENMVVLETSTNLQYRLGMPGPVIEEKEWRTCLGKLDELQDINYLVASGSLPGQVPAGIFADLALMAKRKNARLLIDTSGEALKKAVQAGVFLIKPNLGELSRLMGVDELTSKQVVEAGKELISKGQCQVLVVSMGALGAVLITKDGVTQVTAPAVLRRSTVGAGDSMMAGLVLSLERNYDPEAMLRFGVACGTAATMNPGTELCRKADADHLFQVIGEQFSR